MQQGATHSFGPAGCRASLALSLVNGHGGGLADARGVLSSSGVYTGACSGSILVRVWDGTGMRQLGAEAENNPPAASHGSAAHGHGCVATAEGQLEAKGRTWRAGLGSAGGARAAPGRRYAPTPCSCLHRACHSQPGHPLFPHLGWQLMA